MTQTSNPPVDLPIELIPATAHLWWARPADARPSMHDLLDAGERGRLESFRRPIDSQRFLVGCALLRLIAGRLLGQPAFRVRICRDCPDCGKPHGKPRLASGDSDLEFSVSHAGDRIVVAHTRGSALGVDVVSLDADIDVDRAAGLIAHPSEMEELGKMYGAQKRLALLAAWNRKEAILKALGTGLRVSPDQIAVSGAPHSRQLVSWPKELPVDQSLSLVDLDAGPGHIACLAVAGPCRRIVTHEGRAFINRI
ncbi:MAG: 4'-phosphopantetheinyl transferase superfamily protein [Actinomycetota bacterium]